MAHGITQFSHLTQVNMHGQAALYHVPDKQTYSDE